MTKRQGMRRKSNSKTTDDEKAIAEQCALEEWRLIKKHPSDRIGLTNQWLQKQGASRISGEAITFLLEDNPSTRFKGTARKWLIEYSHETVAPALLGALLATESDRMLLAQARRYLSEAESNFFRLQGAQPEHRRSLGKLMRSIIEHHPRSTMLVLIARYLETFPEDKVWSSVFTIPTYEKSNREADRLIARWIQLNKNNPELGLLGLPILNPCHKVIQASFEWIKMGGRTSAFTGCVLDHVLRRVDRNGPLFDRIIAFGRRWLSKNPSDRWSGAVYATLVSRTLATQDIDRAKAWYECHLDNQTAFHVICSILNLSTRTGFPADSFAVDRARALLVHEENQFPVLIGALLGAAPDDFSTGIAKKFLRNYKLDWILFRLLKVAPDEEAIEMAHALYPSYKNRKNEPELLAALLGTKRADKKIVRRAHFWLRQNPRHLYTRQIKELLHK